MNRLNTETVYAKIRAYIFGRIYVISYRKTVHYFDEIVRRRIFRIARFPPP